MRTLDVVRMVVLCVSYVATAKFGLSLDAVHSVAAAVWPPTGIAFLAQSLSASLNLATVLQRVVAGAQDLCASERAYAPGTRLRHPGRLLLPAMARPCGAARSRVPLALISSRRWPNRR